MSLCYMLLVQTPGPSAGAPRAAPEGSGNLCRNGYEDLWRPPDAAPGDSRHKHAAGVSFRTRHTRLYLCRLTRDSAHETPFISLAFWARALRSRTICRKKRMKRTVFLLFFYVPKTKTGEGRTTVTLRRGLSPASLP